MNITTAIAQLQKEADFLGLGLFFFFPALAVPFPHSLALVMPAHPPPGRRRHPVQDQADDRHQEADESVCGAAGRCVQVGGREPPRRLFFCPALRSRKPRAANLTLSRFPAHSHTLFLLLPHEKHTVDLATVSFTFDGNRLNGSETPEDVRLTAERETWGKQHPTTATPTHTLTLSLSLSLSLSLVLTQLGMEDMDTLDVFLAQVGGR